MIPKLWASGYFSALQEKGTCGCPLWCLLCSVVCSTTNKATLCWYIYILGYLETLETYWVLWYCSPHSYFIKSCLEICPAKDLNFKMLHCIILFEPSNSSVSIVSIDLYMNFWSLMKWSWKVAENIECYVLFVHVWVGSTTMILSVLIHTDLLYFLFIHIHCTNIFICVMVFVLSCCSCCCCSIVKKSDCNWNIVA